MRKWLLIIGCGIVALAIIGAIFGEDTSDREGETTTAASASPTETADPTMNRRTREYVNTASACLLAAGLLQAQIQRGETDAVELADTTTSARNICDGVRSRLSGMSTNHFYDEGLEVWYSVDRFKSGLNALLEYIDTAAPSKLIEARDKFAEGDALYTRGVRQINGRRAVYGLKPLKTYS